MIGWIRSRYRAVVNAYFTVPRRLRAIDVQLKMMRTMKDDVFTFPYGELELKTYLPYAGMDSIQTEIVDTGTFWEIELLERVQPYIGPGAVVLDCGANIGNHSLFFTKVCGAQTVHAFEPQNRCVEIMLRTLRMNDVDDRVDIHQVVLGAKEGTACVRHREAGNIGGTAFSESDSGDYKIRTLDSFDLPRVDFMKIDVEGAHYDLLQGAQKTLARCSPTIWVEMFSEAHGDATYDQNREFTLPMRLLKENGYVVKEKLSCSDYLFVKEGR